MSLRFFVDRADPDLIQGWAFAPGGLEEVRVRRDQMVIGSAAVDGERADVHQAYPDQPESLRSGFTIVPSRERLESPTCTLDLEFVRRDGQVEEPVRFTVYVPREADAAARTSGSPFPPSVLRILADLRGDHYAHGPWTDALQDEAIADLELVVAHGPQTVVGLYGYLGWLRALRARLDFVARHFPRRNPARTDPHDKDFLAVGSSPDEMLTIAHHLYVLRAHGLTGRFLEFGCFKGFSTACLSHACAELGIGMNVFDSFAGLPPSDSAYHGHGEFSGGLEEVRRNVREFGNLDAVSFHPGYFEDTIGGAPLDPLCIWMDVDLQTSSRTVMTILDQLSPQSCVFSHEVLPGHYGPRGIEYGNAADDVVGPIVQAFERVGRHATGRFLTHDTGVFWDRDAGIPVLPTDRLLRLVALA